MSREHKSRTRNLAGEADKHQAGCYFKNNKTGEERLCSLVELSKLQLEGSLASEATALKVKGSSHGRTRVGAWSKHMRAL